MKINFLKSLAICLVTLVMVSSCSNMMHKLGFGHKCHAQKECEHKCKKHDKKCKEECKHKCKAKKEHKKS